MRVYRGLTDAQRRAYILADNRLTELGGWDAETVRIELSELADLDIDINLTGFSINTHDWFQSGDTGEAGEDDSDEYKAFTEKFEAKHTTDDCYTPENIYDAVAEWVAKEYNLNADKFMCPFYPGGDYQKEIYPPDAVVVDNPPFSILAEICRWYGERGIRFFLFAPTLTLFSADDVENICHVCVNAKITFENGANVNIGFKTNLEPGVALRTAPELSARIKECEEINTHSGEVMIKYAYPRNVLTAAMVSGWSEWGVDFKAWRNQVKKITALDAQKAKNLGIYGSGFLCSDMIAAQAAQAQLRLLERREELARKAKEKGIEAGIPEAQINEDGEIVWELSEREREIVEQLNENI